MCTPLTLTLAVITPQNDKQISFGLTHSCNDDGTDSWEIDFTYKEKVSGSFVTLIDLKLNVNPQAQKAQDAANKGLTPNQLLFLQGPVFKQAKKVADSGGPASEVAQFASKLKSADILGLEPDKVQPVIDHAAALASDNDRLNTLVTATLSVQ